MKLKHVMIITALLFVVALSTGLYCKASYKDYNQEDTPLNHFTVGYLPEELLERQIEKMGEILEQSPYIIAAKCESKSKYQFKCATQQVTVEKVFQGEGLNQGDLIEVESISHIFDLDEMVQGEKNPVNLDFVNEMIPGKSYLIFLDRRLDTHQPEDHIYLRTQELLIRPTFCYEKIKNVPCISMDKETNSVDYETVSQNEFFLDSQKSIEKMEKFKEELLGKYEK